MIHESLPQLIPGVLAGASPWTYAAIGIGTVVVLIVFALVLVEFLE